VNLRSKILAALGLWGVAVLAVGLPPGPHFLNFALMGSAAIFLAASPTPRTIGALLLGTLLLFPLHVRFWDPEARHTLYSLPLLLAYPGIAAIGWLALQAFTRRVSKELALGVIGIPAFVLATIPYHALLIRSTPFTVDPALLRIDLALFGEATYATGRLLLRHPWLRWTAVYCYVALPLVGAAVYSLALIGRSGRVRPTTLLCLWGVAGALGAVCYPLAPSVGPAWVFPGWPWHLPPLHLDRTLGPPEVPRNAMPSLHAAWALLVCWGAREAPRWVWALLLPWVLLMLLATVGIGGHYVIDLVAALPLAAAAAWITSRIGRGLPSSSKPLRATPDPAIQEGARR
jgi:membrane-associated phospholipid phosphatase